MVVTRVNSAAWIWSTRSDSLQSAVPRNENFPARTLSGLPKPSLPYCAAHWRLRQSSRARRRSLFYDSRMLRIISLLLWIAFAFAAAAKPAKPERHVVIVVWDGMRPDFVNEQNTPALWKLARVGVTFRYHHAVYPSATMVNGTALVTGVYPSKNGII